jgi:hypothetical protein
MGRQKFIAYFLIVFCLIVVLIVTLRNDSGDYGAYIKITRSWLSDRTPLYSAENFRFQYTPWTLFFFIPFSFLPIVAGKFVFNVLSIALLFWISWRYAKPGPFWAYTLALVNIYLILYLQLGQFDIIVLASIVVGAIAVETHRPWLLGISLVLITTKFTNVLLPTAVLLYGIRKWPLKDVFIVFIFPTITFLLSFAIAGWDWIIRYVRLLTIISQIHTEIGIETTLGITTYKMSYWAIFNTGGKILLAVLVAFSLFILFRQLHRVENGEFHEPSVYLALSINLVASPYILLYHLTYLSPILSKFLTRERAKGLVLLISTFVDLVLCYLHVGFYCFPLITLIILLIPEAKLLARQNQPSVSQ